MSLNFFADENIPQSIVSQLNSAGIDTESVKSKSLKGTDDEQIIKYCIENERILLTMDKDFVSGLEKQFKHKGIAKFKTLYPIGKMMFA